ncbi:MAG: phosphatidylserine decarboxylase [Elusimicrobia bacterium]|nr:phosphatidylserine decarboxylase [Elusimicrobiota bacterium]
MSALSAVSALFTFFLVWFFRDPERRPDSSIVAKLKPGWQPILAPADGKVADTSEINDCLRIGIFLSPFNCHVQRSPFEGLVAEVLRKKGYCLPAYRPDASRMNSSAAIKITNKILGECVVRQITGIVARRILTLVEKDMELKPGTRLGMILLGSRVELEIPRGKAEIWTKVGDKVYAGTTVIGTFTS